MNLLATCLHRLTHRRADASPQRARRRAAAARVARLTRPAVAPAGLVPATDAAAAPLTPEDAGESSPCCGWFDSSHTLRQGLAVTEWSDAELAEGLLAWHAARWVGPGVAQAARVVATA